MKAQVALSGQDAFERGRRLKHAVPSIAHFLRERYPESQGFEHREEVYLAKWAFPSNISASFSVSGFVNALDEDNRDRAFRRRFHVTKGARWNVVVDVYTANSDASAAEIVVSAGESKLFLTFAGIGFVLTLIAALLFTFVAVGADSSRDRKGAILFSFVAAVVVGLAAGLFSRLFEAVGRAEMTAVANAVEDRLVRSVSA